MRRTLASPALWVLALGLALLFARPPLPIDETRYLEVFRESLEGSALLLRLSGEPYAEKPPLLFWLARALFACGVPMTAALRLVPMLASAGLVALVARFARRLELPHAASLAAVMLLPFLVGQMLLFDALLGAAVWLALDGWVRGRDGTLVGGAALALLAKGPVGLLFLAAFLWSLAPLREAPRPRAPRALLLFLLALAPLAGWALAAAHLGGPEFANALLWERWGGRIVKAADHARPWWFYAPVALIGSLPVTGLLLQRSTATAPSWVRRTRTALLSLLVLFTLISGKQAHYLTPLAPAAALLAAHALGRVGTVRALRVGLRVQLCLALLLLGLVIALAPRKIDSFTAEGAEWLSTPRWWLVLVPGLAACALALARTWSPREGTHGLGTAFSALALTAIGLHATAGRLLFPARLARALDEARGVPLAFLGSSHHGFYELAAGRGDLPKLFEASEVGPWLAAHPAGRIVADAEDVPEVPAGTRLVLRDRLHRSDVLLLASADAP